MANSDWIRGFAWPVPRSFAPAVSHSRFEQGDVLYADPSGYTVWPKKGPTGALLQVLDPPKTARAVSGEVEGDRFSVGWGSPVTVEVYAHVGAKPIQQTTTQGRLFTTLWRGELAWLEATAEPPMPNGLKDLQARLGEAVSTISRHFADEASLTDGLLFLLAVDEASESGRVKADAIEAVLADRFEIHRVELSPADAGLDDADALHPALMVRGLAIASSEASVVERHLADLLYAGGDGTASRFSLARHGLLTPLGPLDS